MYLQSRNIFFQLYATHWYYCIYLFLLAFPAVIELHQFWRFFQFGSGRSAKAATNRSRTSWSIEGHILLDLKINKMISLKRLKKGLKRTQKRPKKAQKRSRKGPKTAEPKKAHKKDHKEDHKKDHKKDQFGSSGTAKSANDRPRTWSIEWNILLGLRKNA